MFCLHAYGTLCACLVPVKIKEGAGFPRTAFTDGCELHVGAVVGPRVCS